MRRPAAVRPFPVLALAAIAGLLGGGAATWAQGPAEAPAVVLSAADERPLIGETVRLTVLAGGTPLAGARVSAVYRPNSSTTSTEHLATTDAAGTVFWTPSAAGPVRLEARPPEAAEDAAPAASLAVAVRYGGFPLSGLAIMVIAGVLLLGGAAFGMTMLLRAPPAHPEREPPST
jgi:hypothetical protein